MHPVHLMAIDWSGARDARFQQEHIWIAGWRNGRVSLTNGRTRDETIATVIDAAAESAACVVGFDFAFAYPRWFSSELGCGSAPALWQTARDAGEDWLAGGRPPFWGRPGTRRPFEHSQDARPGLRRTEQTLLASHRLRPSSAFQIHGAGSVGTGSIRGIPHLLTLRQHGFAIWPFDDPGARTAMEIYPRLSVGSILYRDKTAVRRFLTAPRFADVDDLVLDEALHSRDAFDALCALMDMIEHRESLAHLPAARDPIDRLEGRIWIPGEL